MHDVPIGSNRSHHNRIGHLIRLVAGIDEARFKRPAPPVAAEWRRLRNPAANARRPMRKGRSGTAAETGLTRCHGQHADGHYACRSGASPCRGRLIRSLPPARPAQPPLKVSGVPPPPQRMLRHDAEADYAHHSHQDSLHPALSAGGTVAKSATRLGSLTSEDLQISRVPDS
ncbi:hypothetical protein HPB50_024137 [Hyalomma asiaticum]|uniref:Uncharacterized protein n=1 Tax=Hyalomma asiaticum TaxID=266040 RepID=A0ACB7TQR6_HYAAI|nr:hypothetical protein HPB50_024137 [Hyalomma asiaticum]